MTDKNQDPTFDTFEVIGPQPIQFFGGTRIRLNAEQFRRRQHQVTDVEKLADGEAFDVTVKDAVTLKVGEKFGYSGEIPKAYYSSVGIDGVALLDHLAKMNAEENKQRIAKLADKRGKKASAAKAKSGQGGK